MKTKQIVFTEAYKAELLDVDYEEPKANEVTVELDYSAISQGTEKANYIGARNGIGMAEDEVPKYPITVGYSTSGRVVAKGSEVSDLQIGDKVIVVWGKHKKHITVERKWVIKLPDGVSTKEASMAYISIFPLAAIRKTHLEIGESALVMGLGILGIFAVQQLRAAGAYPVIAADPIPERREMALKMGADYALDPLAPEFAGEVKRLTSGGANVCIEVTGLGAGLITALECMKEMGRIALLGCTRSSKFEIDYYAKVHGRGISLIGAHTMARPKFESSRGLWTIEDDIKTVFGLIRGGRVNYLGMVGEINSPTDAQEVFQRLVNDKKFPVGVLFDWSLV